MLSRQALIIANVTVGAIILALIFGAFFIRPIEVREPVGTCAGNLRQLGLALLQYDQDNDEKLPPRQNASGLNGSGVSWRYLIYPYVKSRSVYRCPSNPGAWAPGVDDLNSSYAANATHDDAQCFGPFADKFGNGFPMAGADNPTQTIALVESTASFNDFNPLFPEGFAQPASAQTRVGSLFSGHNRITNVLELDGHLHQMTPTQLIASNGPNPWTTDGAPFSPADQSKAISTMQYSERKYADVNEKTPREYAFIWNAVRTKS